VTFDKQFVRRVVSDTGPGIPPQYLHKIFTRFFRVPESSIKVHGSGLGLFICKQIIENHDGSISVESSDSGTVFSIQLPVKTQTS
jgi:signal transduction histidine kinase